MGAIVYERFKVYKAEYTIGPKIGITGSEMTRRIRPLGCGRCVNLIHLRAVDIECGD